MQMNIKFISITGEGEAETETPKKKKKKEKKAEETTAAVPAEVRGWNDKFISG